MSAAVTRTLVVSQFDDGGTYDILGNPRGRDGRTGWQHLTGPQMLATLAREFGIHEVPSDGAAQIAHERQRQVREEGYSPSHDDRHDGAELALAAAAYASPHRLYVFSGGPSKVFHQVEPHAWDIKTVARLDGHGLDRAPVREMNAEHTVERIRELVKAGALIAAEIDRLRRLP